MTTARIDFDRINAVALESLEDLLPRWLPGGRVNGSEFEAGSLDGEPGKSFKVNLGAKRGVWTDFAGEVGGSDPVSLYAAIHDMGQAEAARKLAEELGIDPGGNGTALRVKGRAKPKPADDWRTILPVPEDAPEPCLTHPKHGQAVAHWAYRDAEGRLLGYTVRFDTVGEDGRPNKEVLPMTYCQGPGGARSWRFKSLPEPCPVYGLDGLARKPASVPVLVVEGEKAADAAQGLAPWAVCLTWPGGCKAVGKADFSPLAGRRVAIWPDADKPGCEAALAVAARVKDAGAAEVSVIVPPDGVAKGWDLADAETEGWGRTELTDHLKAHRMDVEAFEALARERYSIKPNVPDHREEVRPRGWFPFQSRADGIYFLEDNDEPSWLCSPLAVLAMTRDGEGREWGRLVEVVDADGNAHRWAMPMSALAGTGEEYRRELLSMGLRLASGRGPKRLHDYLTLSRPEARARCVNRVGWHGRRFVLPDMVYGPQDGEEVILQGGPVDHAFRVAGNLQDWQESVGCFCPGNSRLVLAVSAALAAPLLALTGAESGGFHLHGGSSTGKTTALRVAGSVCGGGGTNGYLRQWRTTDNALESVSSGACDCLLALDELGQADARAAGAVAYMIANGQGKGRSNRDGTARKPYEWRVLFLSTGEVTLADKVREDGRSRIMAGQAVRVVDIPADAGAGLGAWEDLHGFENGDAFARHLKEESARVYGSPLRAFLERLTASLDDVVRDLPDRVREFVAEACPPGADGQVHRVAARFGLVSAAGELGIDLGVLPWPEGEARQAAARCFRDWLDARGGAGAAEVTAGLAQVRQFFQAHGSSRFETWGETVDASKVINRAGFRRKDPTSEELSFYVFQDVFKLEVCQGHNADMVLRELKARGLLLTQESKGLTVKPRIPGVGSGTRFYHIAPGILGDGEKASVLQKQVGTGRDSRDTLSRLGSGCPYSGESKSGQSGQPEAPAELVPTCPYPENDRSGHPEARNDAMSLPAPNVPTPKHEGKKNEPVPMWDGPAEVLI